MNRSEHSIKNSAWGVLYCILHMIVPLFFRIVIIREVGPEFVGLGGLFKSILSVLNLSELGFGTAIIYLMYKPIAENDKIVIRNLLSLLRKIYLWIGAIILLVGIALLPFLDILVKNDTGAEINIHILFIMYLLHTVASYLLFAYRSALFTAYQRTDINYLIMVICTVVEYILELIVLVTTKNYYMYLLVFTLMIIPQNLAFYFVSKNKYPELYCEGMPSKEQIQIVKTKVISLLGHRIGATAVFSIDDIIISAFLGVSILTSFDNYNYVMTSVVSLLAVLLTSILASIGNKLALDSVEETFLLFKRLTFIWIGIVGWCSTCLLSLYQPFILLCFGEKYLFSEGIVICMATYFFVWQFRQMGLTMKDAAGLWEPDKVKPYIGMILNTILSIMFVKITDSVLGVMIPTVCILLFIYFPWETWVLFKYLFVGKTKNYLLFIFKCLASSVIAICITYLIIRIIPIKGINYFVLRTILCITIMPVIYCGMNCKSPQMKETILMIKKIINKRITKKSI